MLRKIKAVPVEIVPQSRAEMNAADVQKLKIMIAQMVEDGVRTAMTSAGAELQPFFGSHAIAMEIKKRQTVHEQNKFKYYFEDWGCMICGSREKPHHSLGMCFSCHSREATRIAGSLRKRLPASDSIQPTFMDTVKLAREALRPSLKALTGEQSQSPRFRTEGQAADEAGIHPETLSLWIKTGRVKRPQKRMSEKQWLWSDEDIARLKEIVISRPWRVKRPVGGKSR